MDDRVIALLQRTLDAKAAEIDDAPVLRAVPSDRGGAPVPRRVLVGRGGSRPSVGRRLVVATAACVLIGGAAGVIVALRDGSDGAGRIAPADPSAPAVTTTAATVVAPDPALPPVPPPTQPPASTPTGASTKLAGWYVPTYIPDGFEIASITASNPQPRPGTADDVGGEIWVRRGADGIVEDQIRLSAQRLVDAPHGEDPIRDRGVYVHGAPAQTFDGGDGLVVVWAEAQVMVQVTGHLDSAALLAVAEATTVDPVEGVTLANAAALPGYERVDRSLQQAPPTDAVALSIDLLPSDGSAGRFLGLSVRPNTALESFDSGRPLGQFDGDIEQVEIGGIERQVMRMDTSSSFPLTSVGWFADGFSFLASGRTAAPEDVIAFVEGLMPAQRAEVRRLLDETVARTLTLPVVDSTTFADGLAVSVRAAGVGPASLCVEGPAPQCYRAISEGSLTGNALTGVSNVFRIDGKGVLVGWLAGSTDPTVRFAAGDGTIEEGAPAEVVSTASGTFVRADLPDDAGPPEIVVGDNGAYGAGMDDRQLLEI